MGAVAAIEAEAYDADTRDPKLAVPRVCEVGHRAPGGIKKARHKVLVVYDDIGGQIENIGVVAVACARVYRPRCAIAITRSDAGNVAVWDEARFNNFSKTKERWVDLLDPWDNSTAQLMTDARRLPSV